MITKQQRKALLFIEAELDRTGGIAPTVRELTDHFHYRSPTMRADYSSVLRSEASSVAYHRRFGRLK